MRLAIAALLVPALAFADKFRTDVKVVLDEPHAGITETILAVKLDRCWKSPAKAKVRVEFDRGKPKTVELVENGDAKAAACITRAFKAVRLKDAATLTIVVELEGQRVLSEEEKQKRMIEALAKIETTKHGPGFGAGVGTGNGTGTTRGSKGKGTGGGGNAEADFVTTQGPPIGPDRSTPDGPAPKPITVTLGQQQVTGDLPVDEVQRVVKSRVGVFRACYQKELNRSRGIGGKLVVKFTIAPDGSVKSAKKVSSTVGSTLVDECVVRQIMRLKFPARQNETVVDYPFTFAS